MDVDRAKDKYLPRYLLEEPALTETTGCVLLETLTLSTLCDFILYRNGERTHNAYDSILKLCVGRYRRETDSSPNYIGTISRINLWEQLNPPDIRYSDRTIKVGLAKTKHHKS